MSQIKETDAFYAAGRKLAEQIADRDGKEISTASLQALIRDLLPQKEEMQEILKSIVAGTDFLQLVKLAGNDKGVAQKTTFIRNLKKIYNSKTIEAIDSFVDGVTYNRQDKSDKKPGEAHDSDPAFKQFYDSVVIVLYSSGVFAGTILARPDKRAIDWVANVFIYAMLILYKVDVVDPWIANSHKFSRKQWIRLSVAPWVALFLLGILTVR